MKQMLFTSKQNKRWGSEGRGDQKSFLQTDLQKRGIFKWFQLLLYKNILWATFRRIACFMPLKGFPPQMASWKWWWDFYPLGCLGRTLFKTMHRNSNKAQNWYGHKETRPAPHRSPESTLQTSHEPIRVSLRRWKAFHFLSPNRLWKEFSCRVFVL